MSLYSNVYFYGGGAWGQALAISLASIGHGSTLIVSDKIREQEIYISSTERKKKTK